MREKMRGADVRRARAFTLPQENGLLSDDVTEACPLLAVEARQLHRLERREVIRAGVELDAGQGPGNLDKSVGLITTQYLKDQNDKAWANDPAVVEWTAFMKKYYPDGNLAASENFYGWSVAQTLVQVIKQAGNDLTRANVMKQAASLKNFAPSCMLPGIKINTSATDFAPIESVQLARFDGKEWVRFGDIIGK